MLVFGAPQSGARFIKREVESGYTTWYGKRVWVNEKAERPTKTPHVQQFKDGAEEQWAWVAKEEEYRATIIKLKEQLRVLIFEKIASQ